MHGKTFMQTIHEEFSSNSQQTFRRHELTVAVLYTKWYYTKKLRGPNGRRVDRWHFSVRGLNAFLLFLKKSAKKV